MLSRLSTSFLKTNPPGLVLGGFFCYDVLMTETLTFKDKNSGGYVKTSDITPFKFPGGETHLNVPEDYSDKPYYAMVKGANMDDYMALAMWADFHRASVYTHDKLTALIPYLPAARADRGLPWGARVYSRIINEMGLNQVIVFDPHSEVMPNMINNVKVINSSHTVKNAIQGYHGDLSNDYVGVIAPDKGAYERAKETAQVMHLPLFQAEKHRDFHTGKLSGFSCEPLPDKGRLLVVDDICDGGGTFMGLAEATGVHRSRLSLFVSHGIFSGRVDNLWQYYSKVYTTNSHPGHVNLIGATVINIAPVLIPYIESSKP